jgi:hypothetical protein
VSRPSLAAALDVLRTNAATPPEHDLLATVEYVIVEHTSAAEACAADGSWGRCEACALAWPCPAWTTTEAAVTEWLIQRSSLTVRAIREHLKRKDGNDQRKPA